MNIYIYIYILQSFKYTDSYKKTKVKSIINDVRGGAFVYR